MISIGYNLYLGKSLLSLFFLTNAGKKKYAKLTFAKLMYILHLMKTMLEENKSRRKL